MSDRLSRLTSLLDKSTNAPWAAEAFWREGDDLNKPAFRWRVFLLGATNPRTNSRDCDWTETEAKLIAEMRNSIDAMTEVVTAAVEWSKFGRDDGDDEEKLLKAVRALNS